MDLNLLISFLEQWIHLHPQWLFAFILLVSALESLAIVGIVVPGIILLFFAGTLIGKGLIPLEWGLFSAWLGAFIGDFVSFLVGHKCYPSVNQWSIFRRHQEWIKKGEIFFDRYGSLSVFICRFAGPLRAILPFVAGAMGMKMVRFLIIDIVAGFFWAIAYLMPGYLVGSSLQWHHLFSSKFILILLNIAGVSWLLSFLYWRFIKNTRWDVFHARVRVVLGIGLLFILVLWTALVKLKYISDFDQGIAYTLQGIDTHVTDQFIVLITMLGNNIIQVTWMGIVCLFLWWQQGIRVSMVYAALFGSLVLILSALKWTLNVARPPNETGILSYSFPSGHTTLTTFLVLVVTALIASGLRKQIRFWVWGGGWFVILIMALSRIYLHMHWFSDVFGAIILGSFFYILWKYFDDSMVKKETVMIPMTPVYLILPLLLCTAVEMFVLYPTAFMKYIGS